MRIAKYERSQGNYRLTTPQLLQDQMCSNLHLLALKNNFYHY